MTISGILLCSLLIQLKRNTSFYWAVNTLQVLSIGIVYTPMIRKSNISCLPSEIIFITAQIKRRNIMIKQFIIFWRRLDSSKWCDRSFDRQNTKIRQFCHFQTREVVISTIAEKYFSTTKKEYRHSGQTDISHLEELWMGMAWIKRTKRKYLASFTLLIWW